MAEPTTQTPRRPLLKSAEVCDIVKVQPYVLRSWEKEFPDLGVSRAAGGPRLYRQADVDQALRIKQLVFSEGLTLAGARRKLEEERVAASELPIEDDDPRGGSAVSTATRERIEGIKQGLRSLLDMLARRGTEPTGGNGPETPADVAAVDAVPARPARKGTRRRPTNGALLE